MQDKRLQRGATDLMPGISFGKNLNDGSSNRHTAVKITSSIRVSIV
jgi:hypothetical protein